MAAWWVVLSIHFPSRSLVSLISQHRRQIWGMVAHWAHLRWESKSGFNSRSAMQTEPFPPSLIHHHHLPTFAMGCWSIVQCWMVHCYARLALSPVLPLAVEHELLKPRVRLPAWHRRMEPVWRGQSKRRVTGCPGRNQSAQYGGCQSGPGRW